MQLKGAVDQAKSHLKSLQGSSRSTLNLFGAGVERIANAVEQNARKFPGGKKPIGPIGKFIKVCTDVHTTSCHSTRRRCAPA